MYTHVHLHIYMTMAGGALPCAFLQHRWHRCFGVAAQTVPGLAAATALHRALWHGKAWQLGQERRTERRTVSVAERSCQRKRPLRARQAQRGNPGYVRVEGMRVRGMVCVARANDAYIIYLCRHALHMGVSGRLRDTQSR